VQVRFLVGPAGSGKTVRCLTEARQALLAAPEGRPLVLLAPKQGTYQLEQQLLSDPALAGYTRLHILSFQSLAEFVLESLQTPLPRALDEEGRVMVLRNLLLKHREKLKLFRASARLTGFAQQLSEVLRDLQRNCLTPAVLNELAIKLQHVEGLAFKLQDLATLLAEYLDWLKMHDLQDGDCLLTTAAEALRQTRLTRRATSRGKLDWSDAQGNALLRDHLSPARIWVDGFAEFSQQELDFLLEVLPDCDEAVLTFCLARLSPTGSSWFSPWSVVGKTYELCHKRIADLSGAEIIVEKLPQNRSNTRFGNNPVFQHLEQHWGEQVPLASSAQSAGGLEPVENSLRIVCCSNPEGEVRFAAREILKFVRAGARYRDISVLVRTLEFYAQPVQRIFSRYAIPFFLDRRESIAHHPLAELTRSALRTVAFGWQHEDWFAALKSGLVDAGERDLDRLENEALSRGWRGSIWRQPLRLAAAAETPEARERAQRLETEMEALRRTIIWPFERLALSVALPGNALSGALLAAAIRELWDNLKAQQRLEAWAEGEPSSYESLARGSIHQTVWNQCQTWLDNIEMAFTSDALPLREWLPILDAGLSGLTIGSVPPALDQVLIGTVDRSRTPEIKLGLILGMNESVFPALPRSNLLLSDSDREELEKCNLNIGSSARRQLGFERYLAYIACTRARDRVVLTCALENDAGAPLNPSSFLSQILQLVPAVQLEKAGPELDWRDSLHVNELIGPLLRFSDKLQLSQVPELGALLQQLTQYQSPRPDDLLTPELAESLYGPVLRTSISAMERFASCPFKFFVHSGLQAQERKRFELDLKEQGTFQHDVLALFHQELQAERKRWRDITAQQARERIGKIARNLLVSFRDGLFQSNDETRFVAQVITESLQDFVETLVGWMDHQYLFDPVMVELPFGEEGNFPPWLIELGNGFRLELRGRIDRVDLYREPHRNEALCVVIDYKSSQRDLDSVLMAHGVQLQLLTYLNVLRGWSSPQSLFGVNRLTPSGVFYVNLRGRYSRALNRSDALGQIDYARKLAYRHSGRFDARALRQLDARAGQHEPDQFNYRLTRNGDPHQNCSEVLQSADFKSLLDRAESSLKEMGRRIYAGTATVSPYRKSTDTACDQCDYRAICRIDPWTHQFRVLKAEKLRKANPDS